MCIISCCRIHQHEPTSSPSQANTNSISAIDACDPFKRNISLSGEHFQYEWKSIPACLPNACNILLNSPGERYDCITGKEQTK